MVKHDASFHAVSGVAEATVEPDTFKKVKKLMQVFASGSSSQNGNKAKPTECRWLSEPKKRMAMFLGFGFQTGKEPMPAEHFGSILALWF